jgi:hypothetical protein
MLNLMDSVRGLCAGIDPALIEAHFHRLSAAYFERYSAAEVARHLRMLATVTSGQPVAVEFRPLAAQAFEVLVVGIDHSGTLACITAALAANGFDLEDVQVSIYLDGAHQAEGASYFVILLRVSGSLRGKSPFEVAAELRERLALSLNHLAQGNLLEAQSVAADTRAFSGENTAAREARAGANGTRRQSEYEGLTVGGDFRLDRKVAIGGMSEVYLGTQLSLNRTVAVKLFRQEGAADVDSLARFNQEALVLAQFNCAHIVQIFAAGSAPDAGGRHVGWMAMEYMAGGDLGQWLEKHGFQPGELGSRWFRQALEGLSYAHRHRVLHRDLKPHNLLLTGEGHLKVSDFGLLKHAYRLPGDLSSDSAIVGTPQYMSPELALGEPLDERSDIFSLGTTFFYILSGQLPFQKNSPTAVLMQITRQDAPRLCEVADQVPVPLSVIIGRMMARQREERYQDVGVILEDLASYERRGLLSPYQSDSFMTASAAPVERPDVETQAYQPAPEVHHDL